MPGEQHYEQDDDQQPAKPDAVPAAGVETEPAATEGEDQQDDKKHRSMSVDPTSEDDQGEPEDAGEAYGRSNAQKQGLSARHRSGRVRLPVARPKPATSHAMTNSAGIISQRRMAAGSGITALSEGRHAERGGIRPPSSETRLGPVRR